MRRKYPVLLAVVTLAVGVDQAMKSVARRWPVGHGVEWTPGLLRWVHFENAGGVLGWLQAWPGSLRAALFIGAAIGVMGIVVTWMRWVRPGAWVSPACLGLVLGGAIGNSIDRLLRGSVTDVVVLGESVFGALPQSLRVVDRVPAFNAADVFLGLGLVGLMVVVLFQLVDVGPDRTPGLDPPTSPG